MVFTALMQTISSTVVFSLILSTIVSVGVLFTSYILEKRKKKNSKDKNLENVKASIKGSICGVDFGGTLVKVVSIEYAPPPDTEEIGNYTEIDNVGFNLKIIAKQLQNNLKNKSNDVKINQAGIEQSQNKLQTLLQSSLIEDEGSKVYCHILKGYLHFYYSDSFDIDTVKSNIFGLQLNLSSSEIKKENNLNLNVTGGGGVKHSLILQKDYDIKYTQYDELKCLVTGLNFMVAFSPVECYTLRSLSDSKSVFGNLYPSFILPEEIVNTDTNTIFPYMIMNIGTGMSILHVQSADKFERVGGTSLAGGTFLGIAHLLNTSRSYKQIIEQAEKGNSSLVDLSVADICGGDYIGKLGGELVASSLGKLVQQGKSKGKVTEADVLAGLLNMVCDDIAQIATLQAKVLNIKRIFFVGSFLKGNQTACHRIVNTMNFLSKKEVEAVFMVHESYLGAIGSYLEYATNI
eukprot:gene15393-20760_t